ncbi:MAG: hypothetical protein IKQ44_05010 [Lachnospiraceae bacterium]|nr:hypothetical protein [Lachnospiraceae bacterium]
MKYVYGFIVKIYNLIISTKFINLNNRFCRRVRAALFHNICREHEAYFGPSNKERRFYVIRCPQDDMGLFAVINYIVYHLKIAENRGMEPVVDWKYYPNKYFSEDASIGKVNVWELFFEQTSEVKLDEVYKSKNVVMSSGDWDAAALAEARDQEKLAESSRIYNKYIHLNEELKDVVEKEAYRIGYDHKRILAVKIRGTDFITAHPQDHSLVADTFTTIDVIKDKEEEWGRFDGIYLSTEDSDILKQMKDCYGDRLYYTDTVTYERNDIGKGWLGDMIDLKDNNKIDAMKGYLISTYMLARADYLIAPCVGGTVGAMRIKGSYKGIYIS